jgi:hypothetical protein
MKKQSLKIVTKISVALAMLVGSNSLAAESGAGVTLFPSFFYSSSTDELTTKTETNNLFLNLRLGYTMSSGLYLGGIYEMENSESKTTSTAKSEQSAYGASVGYVSNFYVIGSYFLSAEIKGSGGITSYTTGTGFGADLGYTFMMGKWGFGPELSYKSITYEKTKAANGRETTLSKKYTSSDIIPYFAFKFVF